MTLLFDFARCRGAVDGRDEWGNDAPFLPVCADCRRRDPGDSPWQTMVDPAISFESDGVAACDNRLGPPLAPSG